MAILGPNGAGKTTLILHLNGILGNLDKEIKVSNFEYTDENIADIRKTVGVVFQDPDDQLFMPTVIEDVMFGPKNFGYNDTESEELAIDALKQVNMSDFLDRPPHHLSYGQKRKVAIAAIHAINFPMFATHKEYYFFLTFYKTQLRHCIEVHQNKLG